MEGDIITKRVGRTPLIRARKLERDLGIGPIYLKLEGNNPSGHREDRLAYLILRDATARGYSTVCMGTVGTVGASLSYLSQYFDVDCVFFVPSRNKALRRSLLDTGKTRIVDCRTNYEGAVRASREAAEENGWYDANPGLANNMVNTYAFSYIAKEIVRQQGGLPSSVICQTSNGSSIAGLHLGFNQLWVDERIERLPRIIAASTAHGNAIVESFRTGKRELEPYEGPCAESRYNRNLVNRKCFNGQDALSAVYDTDGSVVGVTDDELRHDLKRFRKIERMRLTHPNSFPISALFRLAESDPPIKTPVVVILNDARVELDVRLVTKDDLDMTYSEFLTRLDSWLIQYTDPREEIREAVENAFEKGYVICAFQGATLVGIGIVSYMPFETFFPRYHLSYIATKENVKGRGIATEILQKAIEVSEGDLSLHVEVDNRRAIKLYEKMGLNRKYFRMFYQGETTDDSGS